MAAHLYGSASGQQAMTRRGSPLRLLMVTPRAYPMMGGVETHVAEVTRRLAALGVEVTLLTTDLTGQLPSRMVIDGVTTHRVRAYPANRDYYFAPAIADVIKHGAWDLIHIQSYHTLVAPLAMLAALRADIPYVVTFHGGGHSSRLRNAVRLPQQLALAPLLRRAERLIAVARFEIPFYSRRLGIPADRFIHIPNGAELGSVIRAEHDSTDPDLIVSIGRLERYKGHQHAITALPHMLAARPGLRLWIAGSGPYESELRRLALRLGVADRVEIRAVPPAERSRFAAELGRAALVLLLSNYETHPLAAIEAALLGRPLLVIAASGLAELADEGLARAVPIRSTPIQIAAAALEQLRIPLVPGRVQLPSWDDCAQGLLACYESCLGAVVRPEL